MGNTLQDKVDNFISIVRILYINSSDAICEKLLKIISPSQLVLVQDPDEWRRAFDSSHADIVIIEINDGISELHIAEEIHNLNPYMPIIVITNYNDEAFFLSLIALGVERYIKAPVNDDDLFDAVSSVAHIVKHRKEIEAKNDFIEALLDINPSMLATLNEGEITYLNKTFRKYLNIESVDEFYKVYKSLNSLILNTDYHHNNDNELAEWAYDHSSGIDNSNMVQLAIPDDDEPQSFLLTAVPVTGNGGGYLLSFTNITNIEKEKRRYQYLAEYDSLTKIFNRSKINKELDKEITRVLRYGQRLSMLMIDVDNFKDVNDNYGHNVGDTVLYQTAEILRDKIRTTDILGRYGGDEFLILMPSTSVESAYDIAERIRETISRHEFSVAGKATCSIGVAEYYRGEASVAFIKRADDALYMAKRNGRNKVEIQR